MSFTAGDMCDVQGFLLCIETVVHFREVLKQSPVVQVGCSIDSKLAFEVVSTRIDKLVCALSFSIPHLADYYRVFFAASSVDNKFIKELTSKFFWRKNGV